MIVFNFRDDILAHYSFTKEMVENNYDDHINSIEDCFYITYDDNIIYYICNFTDQIYFLFVDYNVEKEIDFIKKIVNLSDDYMKSVYDIILLENCDIIKCLKLINIS